MPSQIFWNKPSNQKISEQAPDLNLNLETRSTNRLITPSCILKKSPNDTSLESNNHNTNSSRKVRFRSNLDSPIKIQVITYRKNSSINPPFMQRNNSSPNKSINKASNDSTDAESIVLNKSLNISQRVENLKNPSLNPSDNNNNNLPGNAASNHYNEFLKGQRPSYEPKLPKRPPVSTTKDRISRELIKSANRVLPIETRPPIDNIVNSNIRYYPPDRDNRVQPETQRKTSDDTTITTNSEKPPIPAKPKIRERQTFSPVKYNIGTQKTETIQKETQTSDRSNRSKSDEEQQQQIQSKDNNNESHVQDENRLGTLTFTEEDLARKKHPSAKFWGDERFHNHSISAKQYNNNQENHKILNENTSMNRYDRYQNNNNNNQRIYSEADFVRLDRQISQHQEARNVHNSRHQIHNYTYQPKSTSRDFESGPRIIHVTNRPELLQNINDNNFSNTAINHNNNNDNPEFLQTPIASNNNNYYHKNSKKYSPVKYGFPVINSPNQEQVYHRVPKEPTYPSPNSHPNKYSNHNHSHSRGRYHSSPQQTDRDRTRSNSRGSDGPQTEEILRMLKRQRLESKVQDQKLEQVRKHITELAINQIAQTTSLKDTIDKQLTKNNSEIELIKAENKKKEEKIRDDSPPKSPPKRGSSLPPAPELPPRPSQTYYGPGPVHPGQNDFHNTSYSSGQYQQVPGMIPQQASYFQQQQIPVQQPIIQPQPPQNIIQPQQQQVPIVLPVYSPEMDNDQKPISAVRRKLEKLERQTKKNSRNIRSASYHGHRKSGRKNKKHRKKRELDSTSIDTDSEMTTDSEVYHSEDSHRNISKRESRRSRKKHHNTTSAAYDSDDDFDYRKRPLKKINKHKSSSRRSRHHSRGYDSEYRSDRERDRLEYSNRRRRVSSGRRNRGFVSDSESVFSRRDWYSDPNRRANVNRNITFAADPYQQQLQQQQPDFQQSMSYQPAQPQMVPVQNLTFQQQPLQQLPVQPVQMQPMIQPQPQIRTRKVMVPNQSVPIIMRPKYKNRQYREKGIKGPRYEPTPSMIMQKQGMRTGVHNNSYMRHQYYN